MQLKKQTVGQIVKKGINIIFYVCMLGLAWLGIQIFLFSSFRIPSDSMSPALEQGDYVAVCKLLQGPRLFNLFASIRGQQTEIYRLPGFRNIRRNDVVVFNYPYAESNDTIRLSIQSYFIKRCIGLPGDTLQIVNGMYRIKGVDQPLGNRDSQQHIGIRVKNSFGDGIYDCYPSDADFRWNIHRFGPLYIPRQGDRIALTSEAFRLYRKLIAWEQPLPVTCHDSSVYIGDRPERFYVFKKNYYFMAGDNGLNSKDSRYWGLLPEEFMVGKACLIWKSVDPTTREINWRRTCKTIH